MKTVFLTRTDRSDHGTFGVLACPAVGFSCFTLELPWRDNRRSISCVPTGEYVVKIYQSPRFGTVYHLQNVEGRTYILFHSGNYAGDRSKGLKTHSEGCILFGKSRGWIGNQRAVLNSRLAQREFQRLMNSENFKLVIQ